MKSDWSACEDLREGRLYCADDDADCLREGKDNDEDAGCSPLPASAWDAHDRRMITFNAINGVGIMVGICFELGLLMYTSVRSAVLVSVRFLLNNHHFLLKDLDFLIKNLHFYLKTEGDGPEADSPGKRNATHHRNLISREVPCLRECPD